MMSITEWPWQTIVFVFTLGITIINIIRLTSIGFGNGVKAPFQEFLDQWWFFYPCFFYQVWWWSVNYIL